MPNRRPSTDPEALRRARRLRLEATGAEFQLWSALRGGRVGGSKFRRQVVFGDYILDFYCPASQLVVEIDGDSHECREEYDSHRDAWLHAQGLRVLRFTNDEVMRELESVIEGIRLNLVPSPAGRGWPEGPGEGRRTCTHSDGSMPNWAGALEVPTPPGRRGRAAAGEGRRTYSDSDGPVPISSNIPGALPQPSPGPSGHPLPAGEGTKNRSRTQQNDSSEGGPA